MPVIVSNHAVDDNNDDHFVVVDININSSRRDGGYDDSNVRSNNNNNNNNVRSSGGNNSSSNSNNNNGYNDLMLQKRVHLASLRGASEAPEREGIMAGGALLVGQDVELNPDESVSSLDLTEDGGGGGGIGGDGHGDDDDVHDAAGGGSSRSPQSNNRRLRRFVPNMLLSMTPTAHLTGTNRGGGHQDYGGNDPQQRHPCSSMPRPTPRQYQRRRQDGLNKGQNNNNNNNNSNDQQQRHPKHQLQKQRRSGSGGSGRGVLQSDCNNNNDPTNSSGGGSGGNHHHHSEQALQLPRPGAYAVEGIGPGDLPAWTTNPMSNHSRNGNNNRHSSDIREGRNSTTTGGDGGGGGTSRRSGRRRNHRNNRGDTFESKCEMVSKFIMGGRSRKTCAMIVFASILVIAGALIGAFFLTSSSSNTNNAKQKGKRNGDEWLSPETALVRSILQPKLEHLSKYAGGVDIFNDRTSPQSRALSWLASDEYCSSITTEDDLENLEMSRIEARYALAVLYYSTNGTEWLNQYLFLSPSHECGWFQYDGYGVECASSSLEISSLRLGTFKIIYLFYCDFVLVNYPVLGKAQWPPCLRLSFRLLTILS